MMSPRKNSIGYLIAPGGAILVTALFRFVFIGVNTTTVALSFLLVVLAVASTYGLGPAIVGSLAAMVCFNFYFLPPVGALTIQDPQNWVALFAFLITAVIASQLSSAAQERAREAEKRRAEVWKLYQLSRSIVATPDSETATSSIARQVVEAFDLEYCAVFIRSRDEWTRVAVGGDYSLDIAEADIESALTSSEVVLPTSQSRFTYAPLKVGVKPVGVMVLSSRDVERGTVEAIAGLVALALERARFLTEVRHTEALRQSDELKAAILASISHDLRTPLTSIRAAVESLLEENISWDRSAVHEFHLIISEEVSRLSRLVDNLLEMARIEAGELKLTKRWDSIAEIFSNVLLRCERSLREHHVRIDADENQPLVFVDSRLIGEALANLVENSARYSPAGTDITISGNVQSGQLIINVSDEGIGIPPDEINKVFDKFYRGAGLPGKPTTGTGMGLAIARGIVEAHGGRIRVESRAGHGATFSFAIPVACKSAAPQALPAESA